MKLRSRIISEEDEKNSPSIVAKKPKMKKPTKKRSSKKWHEKTQPSSSHSLPKEFNEHDRNCKRNTWHIVRSMADLPDHLLVWTFEQLAVVDRIKVERVCQKWRHLARMHSWTRTTSFCFSSLLQQTTCMPWRCIEDRPKVRNVEMRSILSRAGKYLQRIDLGGFRDSLNYSICTAIAHHCCRNLHYLCLTGIQLTNSSLSLIGRHCSELRSITLQRCFQACYANLLPGISLSFSVLQDSVVERGLSGLLSKCTNLSLLDVSENERLCGLPSFNNLPASLRTLIITGCFQLTTQAVGQIGRRCDQLERLAMDNVDMIGVNELNSLFASLFKLKTLKFGECFASIEPGGTELINMGRLVNLTELVINDNLLITNSSLIEIANRCKNLHTIDVSGCNRSVTDEGVSEFAKLPKLVHLNLSLLRITDDCVKAVVQPGKLQSLLLHRCDLLTDSSLLLAAKNCKDLIKVDVSYCTRITDTTLWAFFRMVDKRTDSRTLKMWIGRSSASVPTQIVHKLLELICSDNVGDNSNMFDECNSSDSEAEICSNDPGTFSAFTSQTQLSNQADCGDNMSDASWKNRQTSINKSESNEKSRSPKDKQLAALLDSRVIKPGYEQQSIESIGNESKKAAKRRRKMESERTKGPGWFNLPATEMTTERKNDLELLRMRGIFDTKTHYRKNAQILPKYFQMGRIVEMKVDFYHDRVPKKQQKRTLVNELLADAEFQRTNNKRYDEIKAKEAVTKRGAFRHRSFPPKKRTK